VLITILIDIKENMLILNVKLENLREIMKKNQIVSLQYLNLKIQLLVKKKQNVGQHILLC
jgi:hypothetical protein